MTLIVEDGTGLADAESFCSVADADTYHSNRGSSLWETLLEEEKEQALRRATDYMEQAYGDSWAGYRYGAVQALSWPRYNVPYKDLARDGRLYYPETYGAGYYPVDAVPVAVVRACAELALRAASGELAPDIGTTDLVKREKVGPIETEYVVGAAYVRYRAIDMMLLPFLVSKNQFPIYRA